LTANLSIAKAEVSKKEDELQQIMFNHDKETQEMQEKNQGNFIIKFVYIYSF